MGKLWRGCLLCTASVTLYGTILLAILPAHRKPVANILIFHSSKIFNKVTSLLPLRSEEKTKTTYRYAAAVVCSQEEDAVDSVFRLVRSFVISQPHDIPNVHWILWIFVDEDLYDEAHPSLLSLQSESQLINHGKAVLRFSTLLAEDDRLSLSCKNTWLRLHTLLPDDVDEVLVLDPQAVVVGNLSLAWSEAKRRGWTNETLMGLTEECVEPRWKCGKYASLRKHRPSWVFGDNGLHAGGGSLLSLRNMRNPSYSKILKAQRNMLADRADLPGDQDYEFVNRYMQARPRELVVLQCNVYVRSDSGCDIKNRDPLFLQLNGGGNSSECVWRELLEAVDNLYSRQLAKKSPLHNAIWIEAENRLGSRLAEALPRPLGLTPEEGVLSCKSRSKVFADEYLGHCPACCFDPTENNHCGRCLKLGWKSSQPSHSNFDRNSYLYQVHRVLYEHGRPWLRNTHIARCYRNCMVSWFEHKGNPFSDAMLISNSMKPNLICGENDWNVSALVVSVYLQWNLYHFMHDVLFVVYLTWMQIARDTGCGDQIKIFTVSGEVRSTFWPIWWALLGNLPNISDMHGCFREVYYGQLINARLVKWPYTHRGWLQDPTLASWLTPFASSLKFAWRYYSEQNASFITPTTKETTSVNSLVLLHHERMPDWMWNFQWELVEQSSNVSLERANFSNASIADQVRSISQARGIISIEGAGLAHQFWLPAMSAILVINYPSKPPWRNRVTQCRQLPETWHDTTGLHLGHSVIDLTVCNDEEEFKKNDPIALVRFLLKSNEQAKDDKVAWVCVIYPSRSRESNWPSCDRIMKMPVVNEGSLPECLGLHIGRPMGIGRDVVFEGPFGAGLEVSVDESNASSKSGKVMGIVN